MKTGIRSTALGIAFGVAVAAGQTGTGAPILDPVVIGHTIVSGSATPGASPIDIYDTSFASRAKIGTATAVAPNGKFSCAIKPALVAGHTIIAIDKSGRTSAVSTVAREGGSTTRVP